jgi:hypothetical protein
MLKKSITFVDFDGKERKEDFLFHLSKAEIAKLELSTKGGLVKTVESYVAEKDAAQIIDLFERIIRLSYGEKSLDGREFVKTEEVFNKFYYTEAYSILFMELMSDSNMAASFINGIMPQEVKDQKK